MIELTDVGRTYPDGSGGVAALRDVHLTIREGEYVAIIGPSGSGKSTLLHLLGFLDRPDHGRYSFLGIDTTGLSETQLATLRNRYVGFVFQQFHLLGRATVVDNVMLPLVYAGRRDDRDAVMRHIEDVGLRDRSTHRPNQLSGGEQQRVAIARALVNRPRIILADEPTGNLDSRTEQEIVRLLESYHERGTTLVVVTHEKGIADRASRVIQMLDGRIVSDETRRPTTTAKPEYRQVGADLPTTEGGARLGDHGRQALRTMLAHKTRSLLSMLGVLIGVGAVIAMMAVTEGAAAAVRKQLSSMGSNLLTVQPGIRRVFGVALERGTWTPLTLANAEELGRLPSVRQAAAQVRGRAQIVWNGQNRSTEVQGVGVNYPDMRASQPVVGRFFTAAERDARARVAVVGTTVVRELFGNRNPVGEVVRLNRIPFTVIGVVPSKGGPSFHDADDVVLVPLPTAMYRLLGKQNIDSIDVEVKDSSLIEQAKGEITACMTRGKYVKDPGGIVNIRDMTEIQETIKSTTRTMSSLLGIIAGISLLVGGIGIMNIMLVSVTERTREIGLRKAIGARNRDILLQFLVESVTMTLTGGVIGFALGTVAAVILSRVAGWPVYISVGSALLAMLFSGLVGLAFGLWPARKASRLDPITALRYE